MTLTFRDNISKQNVDEKCRFAWKGGRPKESQGSGEGGCVHHMW